MTEIKDVDREAAAELFGIPDGARINDGAPILHAFAAHREAAEKAERERIVAWLRTYPSVMGPIYLASRI